MSGAPEFAFEGRLATLTAEARGRLLDRGGPEAPERAATVRALLDDVRRRGDEALRAQVERFDGVRGADLEVPRSLWDAALEDLAPADRDALLAASDAIRRVHEAFRPAPIEFDVRPGVRVGRRPEPLERVGVYVPGGRAAYPSSLLMGALPARVAGVGDIVVCSPPGPDGLPAASLRAACAIAGVDRLFAVGGAGAVAAMTYGTATIPRVDRIVGPGNAWVTEARRQVAGELGRFESAGPSEVLIVCDAPADDRRLVDLVTAELLAQAEHDPEAAAVLVALEAGFCRVVRSSIQRRLGEEPRGEIIRKALARRGALLTADSRDEALAFASDFAPEHLALYVAEPRRALASVRRAGSVVLGADSSVVFGDYATGTNHVLPTGGRARVESGLSTGDFVRWTTWQEVSADGAAWLAPVAETLAALEGFPAHGRAAGLRRGAPVATAEATDASGLPDGAIPLDDNRNLFANDLENPLEGYTVSRCQIARYPDPFTRRLKEALARRAGCAPEEVAVGCGSDDLLDAAFRALGAPGERVAFCAPTFSMVPHFVRTNRGVVQALPPGPALAPDIDALIAAGAPLTYLARPNNPTGGSVPARDVGRLVAGAAGLVLLDEAYVEYSTDEPAEPRPAGLDSGNRGSTGAPARADNLLVARTFSKAWGLAGLRVGWMTGPAALIRAVEEARGPYKVSVVAEEAALRALENDSAVRRVVEQTRRMRERLRSALADRGLAALPSEANFLCVPLAADDGPARVLAARLLDRGVAVRVVSDETCGFEAIRITVGPRPLLERLLAALDAVLPEVRPCR
jgi:histidinol dehydrogenase